MLEGIKPRVSAICLALAQLILPAEHAEASGELVADGFRGGLHLSEATGFESIAEGHGGVGKDGGDSGIEFGIPVEAKGG